MKKYKKLSTFLNFIQFATWFFVGYTIPLIIFVDWKYLLISIIALAVNFIARDAIEIIKIKDFRRRSNTSDIGGE